MKRNGDPHSPGGDKEQLGGRGGGDRVRGRGRTVHRHHQEPQKDWGSERVASSAVLASRRQTITGDTTAAAGSPLNPLSGGRPLPSKWEDAERWICSPISASDRSHFPGNRTKSKSGPLEQPGSYAGYQQRGSYSPAALGLEGWSERGFFWAGSPFSTGMFVADKALTVSRVADNNSKGVHRWLDERVETPGDTENEIAHAVSRRDMATQMSPDSSICSSPRRRTSVGLYPHDKLEEARDFLRDGRSNAINWSNRNAAWFKRRDWAASEDSRDDFTSEVRASLPMDIRQTVKSISRVEREEAKIMAWENLQKAKAEAAIGELEVKLEKKRLSSMDRILKKLRKAELKGQEMRRSIGEDCPQDHPRNTNKEITARKHFRPNILFRCLRCHSF